MAPSVQLLPFDWSSGALDSDCDDIPNHVEINVGLNPETQATPEVISITTAYLTSKKYR